MNVLSLLLSTAVVAALPPADSTADPVLAAVHSYRAGEAPLGPVRRDGMLLYPYGHSIPELRCHPLRVCVVTLAGDEVPSASMVGDSARWQVSIVADAPRPLVAIKPHYCATSTNLVLATSRRVYDLRLISPPCAGADSGSAPETSLPYPEPIGFFYPDEALAVVATWEARTEATLRNRLELASGTDVSNLNFDYKWTDRGRPWAPLQVFDDGERTILKMPADRSAPAPLLFLLEGDKRALLNYTVKGDTYLTDRVLERAQLVLTEGNRRRTVTITNRRRSR